MEFFIPHNSCHRGWTWLQLCWTQWFRKASVGETCRPCLDVRGSLVAWVPDLVDRKGNMWGEVGSTSCPKDTFGFYPVCSRKVNSAGRG